MILLSGAKVYKEGSFGSYDLLVEDGRIVSVIPTQGTDISDELSGDGSIERIELNNYYIFPGFVDVHVHLREPGFLYKEDIRTGTMAAAHGGYTSICSMPNLNPAPDSMANLRLQLESIKEKAVVKVYPYGTITKGEAGQELSDMSEMAGEVIAFSDDGRGVQTTELMEQAMLKAKGLGKIIVAHCEDNSLLGGSSVHDGMAAEYLGIRGITSESEWKQVERDIELVRRTGCSYHVCHVSAKESVELIREAKAEGLDITCETAPHYLLLTEEDILEYLKNHPAEEQGNVKMNPPVRTRADREALLKGLRDGTIDMIATDHAPHGAEEKSMGILKCPMGIVGLETAFPLLYTYLVKTEIISLERLVELMCINPAKRFTAHMGEHGNQSVTAHNGIHEGMPADLTVYRLDDEYEVDSTQFNSKGRAMPFDGWSVSARCIMTMADGKIVYRGK